MTKETISDSKTGLVRDRRIARIWRKAAKQLDVDLVTCVVMEVFPRYKLQTGLRVQHKVSYRPMLVYTLATACCAERYIVPLHLNEPVRSYVYRLYVDALRGFTAL